MPYSENCDFARYTKIGAPKCKENYGNMLIFRKILCSCVNIFLPFLLTTIICYLPSCTFVVYIFKCMHCLGCCCFFVFFFCFCLFVCFGVFFAFFLIYKTYNLFIMNALNNTVDKCYLLFLGGIFCKLMFYTSKHSIQFITIIRRLSYLTVHFIFVD